jgi:methionine-rich copper-binding protein CopC
VNVAANVTATFDENVTGVNGSSFTLSGPSGQVAATVSYNAGTRTATLNPSADLAAGVSYTANLSNAIKDAANNALAPVSWSFTTAAPQDTTPPTVTDKSPANGATNVNVAANVTATFDENVTGVNGSSFTLSGPSGQVAATVSYNAGTRTATLNPSADLAAGVSYTANLSNAIKDAANNALAPASWSFTTASGPPPSGNLLLNPSFELDANNNGKPDNWNEKPEFTRSNAIAAHQGGFTGRFVINNEKSITIFQKVGNLTAGTYDLSGWVNIPNTSDTFIFRVKIKWLNSKNKSLRQDTLITIKKDTEGAWIPVTSSLVAPSGATSAEVQIFANKVSATVYVDDFSFTRR